jgi:16S rRNA (guanine527-N7)-methyltransferase
MDPARIAELLQPFLASHPGGCAVASLSESQLCSISMYIDILARWNQKLNLTSVRQPEDIVTRHFGESLFAARHLFPSGPPGSTVETPGVVKAGSAAARVVDVGSGAGFPGLPIKIWRPTLSLTLIESNHKKATFLREVIRTLTLTDIDVFAGRSEDYPPVSATLVTLRAVERFESAVAAAAHLVATPGRLALLMGSSQAIRLPKLAPQFLWSPPVLTPLSSSRVLLVGTTR